MSDHLGECETCRRQIEGAINGDAAFFALKSEIFSKEAEISSLHLGRAHLTPKQTALYVEGNLADEELQTINDHLTMCDTCALAVDDLRDFRDQVAPSLGREYHPALVASPLEGWWQRTIDSLSGLFRGSPKPAFAAILAILVATLLGC